MKIGILTFQFAHNYGALLQAYGLRQYLKTQGYEVEILNYIPPKVRKEYSMNPFVAVRSLRGLVSLTIRNAKRVKQFQLIRKFQMENLCCGKALYTSKELQNQMEQLDCVVVGSDQVWNTALTGEISDYYLDVVAPELRKVSYAASFGTDTIQPFQQQLLRKHLQHYHSISVREDKAKEIIRQYTDLDATVVADPVFLISKEQWKEFALKPVGMKENELFVVYYSLKDNPSLARMAEKQAKERNAKLFMIHPTAANQKVRGKQLYNVGPREFVWLIAHAECVVSNSFHATAFSTIFNKTLYYQEVEGLGSRVKSLFNQLDVDTTLQNHCIDLSEVESTKVEALQIRGTSFLEKALK